MAGSFALRYCLHSWLREHDLSCLPEPSIGGHAWCADVHEYAPIVRGVEQFAGQHIAPTGGKEAKGSYGQQSAKGWSHPVEPVGMPGPGNQSGPKASCWIQTGTGDRRFQPDHHSDQNPYHERRPTHEPMATHKKKNGGYEQKSQAHLCQEYNPKGINCSGYCRSISYNGSISSPDKHHQQRTNDRTEQLTKNVPSQVKMMHLPLHPERQRYGRIDMTTTELPEGRNGDERTTPCKQETRDESTDTCIRKDMSQR